VFIHSVLSCVDILSLAKQVETGSAFAAPSHISPLKEASRNQNETLSVSE